MAPYTSHSVMRDTARSIGCETSMIDVQQRSHADLHADVHIWFWSFLGCRIPRYSNNVCMIGDAFARDHTAFHMKMPGSSARMVFLCNEQL